ncbi:MAG: TonB-dependent receptor, partial [Gemmatimonadetes bacterium]|nr:TonB-dependent receptor [Gemmatimonadota bacterium]
VPASAIERREQAIRSPYPVTWVDFAVGGANLHGLSDLLESVPGVRVKRYGGLGAIATPSVRGSGASQVEVFLDGVSMNSAQWGITNLSDLPVQHLDHAEIYRSGASLASGRIGIGGALHLYSRRADAPRTTFTSSAGSFDTYQNSLFHSRPVGPAQLLASYSRTESDGDFTYRYDPGTRFYNESDDSEVRRENNRFHEEGLLLKLLSPLPGGASIQAQGDWYDRRGGIAGHGNLLFDAASSEGTRRLTSLLVNAPPMAGGRFKNEASGYLLARTARFENPLLEKGLSSFPMNHETQASGARWSSAYHWIEAGQTMRVFLERRDERFTPSEDRAGASTRPGAAPPATFARERTLSYWGAENRASFANDRVSLTASVQGQESEDNFHGPVPFGRPPEARDDRHRSAFTGNA